MRAQLFTATDHAHIPWPATADGDYARRCLSPMMQHGVQHFVANAYGTDLGVVIVDDTVLPFTLASHQPGTTYTCSPFSHYIGYAREEVALELDPYLVPLLRPLLSYMGWALRPEQFDRVVYVNNWLLSTNLYPDLKAASAKRLVDAVTLALSQQYPDRAIVFRSVDAYHNQPLFAALSNRAYRLVLSRQIYYQEAAPALKKRQVKNDARNFRKSGYAVLAAPHFSDADLHRALELYKLLYLDKYSSYNPMFTLAFLQLARREGMLRLIGLSKGRRLDAVLGYVTRGGVMTQPLFGYDTALPRELGLYRSLSLLTLLEGERLGLRVNASSGVGEFKRSRGGVGISEYNAVYDQHLPLARRTPWALLEHLSRAAVPLFKRLGF